MAKEIEAPDGSIVEFPDNMNDDAIAAVMRKQFAAPPKTAAPAPSMSAGDVAVEAVSNLIPSAINLGKNVANTVMHPIDTIGGVVNAGRGAGQQLAHMLRGDSADREKTEQEQTFDALKNYFGDRYGSVEGAKRAVATDPVGVMADASGVLGGSGLLLKGARAKQLAAALDRAGTLANPIALGAKGLSKATGYAGKGLSEVLGFTAGTGSKSVREGFGSGLKGGSSQDAFQAHMRGDAPLEEIIGDAQSALGNLKRERGAAYRSDIGGVNSDPTVLSMASIDAAIAKADNVNSFNGIDLSPSTTAVRTKINDTLEVWRKQDPAKFHTVEGMDALKKLLGDIRDSAPYGTPERVIADTAYNAVRSEIVKQAPAYGKVMKDYETASNLISEVQKTLSLKPGTMPDTTLRKLQSTGRNNVNTNFGRREKLAELLENAGATDLQAKIAGQSMNSWAPRGMSGKVMAGLSGATGYLDPTTLAALPATSPRLVGEAALLAGKAARYGKKAIPTLTPARAKAALLAELLGQADDQSQNRGATAMFNQ